MIARRSGWRGTEWLPWLGLALAFTLLLRPFALFWSTTPEYNFGWGVPFLAFYLGWVQWPMRPPARPLVISHGLLLATLFAAGFLLLALRLLLETEPGWRPALWLDFALITLLAAGWLALAGGTGWVRRFGFPLLFLSLAVPWPWNFEAPLVQLLMRANTLAVADLLTLVDIPVLVEGHTLVLATGRLGVEEACSGIRTLQTSLLVSLFLGEFFALTWRRRLLLVLLTITAAILANGARLLFLAMVATWCGTETVLRWHDSAGAFELAATLGSGFGLALLNRTATSKAAVPISPPDRIGSELSGSLAFAGAWLLCGLALGAELGTQSWYAWREQAALARPSWTLELPTGATAFQNVRLPQITLELLRCDAARAARWQDAEGRQWTVDWFRYRPRPGNKIVVAAHNPLICLPQIGWHQTAAGTPRVVTIKGVTLKIEDFVFSHEGTTSRVYWTVYDRQSTAAPLLSQTDLYQPSGRAFLQRAKQWLGDVWRGSRGADAETLEVTLSPSGDREHDRAAYLAFLHGAIRSGVDVPTAMVLAR